MRINEINNIDYTKMRLRAVHRLIMSGQLTRVPMILKYISLRPPFDPINQFQLDADVYFISSKFVSKFMINKNSIDIDPICLYSRGEVAVIKILNDKLGERFSDVKPVHSNRMMWPHAYTSPQFQQYVIRELQPWAEFITFPHSQQHKRFEWLESHAGKAADQDDLLQFVRI